MKRAGKVALVLGALGLSAAAFAFVSPKASPLTPPNAPVVRLVVGEFDTPQGRMLAFAPAPGETIAFSSPQANVLGLGVPSYVVISLPAGFTFRAPPALEGAATALQATPQDVVIFLADLTSQAILDVQGPTIAGNLLVTGHPEADAS